MTDGCGGKPHLLTLCNGDTFQFLQFKEVINKYGDFKYKIDVKYTTSLLQS